MAADVKPSESAALVDVPARPADFLKQVGAFLRPYWKRCLLLVPIMAIQTAFYLFVPLSFKLIFDGAIETGDVGFLWQIIGALSVGFVVVTVADLGRAYLSAGLGMQVMNDIRTAMFNHLQRLPMGFYASAQTGDILSRFTNDLNAIDRAVTHGFYKLVLNAVIVVATVIVLFTIEWRLALATLVAMPLVAIGPKVFVRRATWASLRRREAEAGITQLVQEHIRAQKVIRAFGLEAQLRNRFQHRLHGLHGVGVRSNFFAAIVERTSSLGILFVQLLVVGLGAYLAISGYMTSGAVVGFVGLLVNVGDSVGTLTSVFPDLIQATGGMQRVQAFLNEGVASEMTGADVPMPRLEREIRFDDVSFSYTGEKTDLDRLSFVIPAGQSVAFIGRSGSGKSTVLNLLTRFYDAGQGTIAIDGRDVKRVSQASLRSQIGAVFQDTFLFNASIRENIRQGRLDATDAEVEEAARAAEIHDVIVGFEGGYDAVVGEEGGRLSGGQRQRIALARAILRNPSILVLDEATSALDPATEAAINATLEKLAKNRTIVSVTHRLSSAMNMDRLFVMDSGRLVEEGSHRELLNQKGLYYQMWQDYTLDLTQQAIMGDVGGMSGRLGEDADDQAGRRVQDLEKRLAAERGEVLRLQEINRRWAQLAGTDRLTGLPNKVAFFQALAPQQIQQAQRRGDPVGFVLLSGDNFGAINEAHGREAGDQVLRRLSQFLKSILKGEELLGHIDGTHFIVVLSPASFAQAWARAEEVRQKIEAACRFSLGEAVVSVTVSAGAASLDCRDVGDARAVVEDAFLRLSEALYRAKRAGGNRVEVTDPLAAPTTAVVENDQVALKAAPLPEALWRALKEAADGYSVTEVKAHLDGVSEGALDGDAQQVVARLRQLAQTYDLDAISALLDEVGYA